MHIRLFVFALCAALCLANEAKPTVVEAAPLSTVSEAAPVWTDSQHLFPKKEESGLFSFLKNTLTNSKEKISNVISSFTGGSAAAASSSSADAQLQAFESAFKSSLGDSVVVVDDKSAPQASVKGDNNLLVHIHETKQLQSEIDAEKKKEQEKKPNVKAEESDDEEDDEEDDDSDSESDENAPEIDVNVASDQLATPEIASQVGKVLGHLFKHQLTEADGVNMSPPNVASAGPAAVPEVPLGVESMHEWALKQMNEMQGLIDLREDLRRRNEEIIASHLRGETAEKQGDHDDHDDHHHGHHHRHHRHGHHHRKHHRKHGRNHHDDHHNDRKRRHFDDETHFSDVLNHILNDQEIPNFDSHITRLIPMGGENGKLIIRLKTAQ